ncbi:DUF1684 domain-containing protein [Candidatus Sumerlaeota bacterium]|nr:DUF1684 domain-containing protein [Candidatus Sumerlaeota bacterium]
MDVQEWKDAIETERRQKDLFFKGGYQSPIPFEERADFKGLNYYPPEIKYRFELELAEHPQKEIIKIEDTKGNIREFIRWGEFRFNIDGVDCTLQAYKSDKLEERLFVPFRDLTSGKETYGAGRYLDLEPERDLTPEGKWILDFNKAYNPWCAYSKDYACPFTPPENWLNVYIRAGEKNYK